MSIRSDKVKKITFKQLGSICDYVFSVNTFEKIAKLSKKHAMEMFKKEDKAHLEAIELMKKLMKEPEKMN